MIIGNNVLTVTTELEGAADSSRFGVIAVHACRPLESVGDAVDEPDTAI